MAIMEYSQFRQILNETIFENTEVDLIEKLAKYPSRYTGLFRPTRPRAKVLQNLMTSHEIRFGDALEHAIEKYLELIGCELLPKRINDDGNALNIDQLFRQDRILYFVEQKVRDDHDSAKKRGQTDNFRKKLIALKRVYPGESIIGIVYFIDPDLEKNKNYYVDELLKMSREHNTVTSLLYGRSLFDQLGCPEVWHEMVEYLRRWKDEIPDFPESNFDLNAEHTFNEIKDLDASVFIKLFSNQELCSEILPIIFPEKKTLHLLLDHFRKRGEYDKKYKKLTELLGDKLNYR